MGLLDFLKGPDINAGVKEFRETAGAVLVDVREADEYAEGHIPDAVHLPLSAIQTAPQVLSDKDAPLYLYCLSGARSGRATAALKQMGYTNVRNIGGINAWRGEVR